MGLGGGVKERWGCYSFEDILSKHSLVLIGAFTPCNPNFVN
jgi:hypothetical protein